MARTSPSINAAIFKDRRVQLTILVAALLTIGTVVFLLIGRGTDDAATSTASPDVATPAPDGTAPGAGVMFPGSAGAVPSTFPSSPTGGTSSATGGASQAAGRGGEANSFADAPPGFAGGAAAGASAVADPFGGGPAGPAAGGTAGAGGASSSKPSPVVPGRLAKASRPDPFVSFFKLVVERPPAYLYAQPIRVASFQKPADSRPRRDPEIDLGPLPPVQRRVAGILYNGSVSAILETGAPGTGSDVEVVRPGDTVESGIAGIQDLTVESIGPTGLVLRATDGRRAEVKLSGAPGLGATGGGDVGGGDFPGGAPGGPPVGGFPGGRGGRGGRGGGGAGAADL